MIRYRRSCCIATVLTPPDFEAIKKIAESHKVTASALLRGMIVDLIAEESVPIVKTVKIELSTNALEVVL